MTHGVTEGGKMELLDRWFALLCAIMWGALGVSLAFDLVSIAPAYFGFLCLFPAMHRFAGCTSFLGRNHD